MGLRCVSVLARKGVQAAEGGVCVCLGSQAPALAVRGAWPPSPSCWGKAGYHANVQVNTILELHENGGKGSPSAVSRGEARCLQAHLAGQAGKAEPCGNARCSLLTPPKAAQALRIVLPRKLWQPNALKKQFMGEILEHTQNLVSVEWY